MFVSAFHQTGLDSMSFFIVGILGKGEVSQETRVLLDYVGHWFTRCNVTQMTLLDLDAQNVT